MRHNLQPAGPNGASFPEAIGPPFLPPSRAQAAVQVLLVEDDELVRECLGEVLGDAGWRAGRAADAKDALDRMALFGVPGVLVTDLALGCGMSGLALIAAARLRWPGVPAVLISGTDAAEPALAPGDRFLRKPFDPGNLLQAVSGLIEGMAKLAHAAS